MTNCNFTGCQVPHFFTGCQVPHFAIVLIPSINLLNLSWIKKMSIFDEYGAFNSVKYSRNYGNYSNQQLIMFEFLDKYDKELIGFQTLYINAVAKKYTIFDLITAHTAISPQSSSFVVFRLHQCTFCLLLYIGIFCGYSFELHRLVDAIQMSTHNIYLYEENQE